MKFYITIEDKEGNVVMEGVYSSHEVAIDNLYNFASHNEKYKAERYEEIQNLPF